MGLPFNLYAARSVDFSTTSSFAGKQLGLPESGTLVRGRLEADTGGCGQVTRRREPNPWLSGYGWLRKSHIEKPLLPWLVRFISDAVLTDCARVLNRGFLQ